MKEIKVKSCNKTCTVIYETINVFLMRYKIISVKVVDDKTGELGIFNLVNFMNQKQKHSIIKQIAKNKNNL